MLLEEGSWLATDCLEARPYICELTMASSPTRSSISVTDSAVISGGSLAWVHLQLLGSVNISSLTADHSKITIEGHALNSKAFISGNLFLTNGSDLSVLSTSITLIAPGYIGDGNELGESGGAYSSINFGAGINISTHSVGGVSVQKKRQSFVVASPVSVVGDVHIEGNTSFELTEVCFKH